MPRELQSTQLQLQSLSIQEEKARSSSGPTGTPIAVRGPRFKPQILLICRLLQAISPRDDPPLKISPRRNLYPNPGLFGPSSHVAIFNQIYPDDDRAHEANPTLNPVSAPEGSNSQSQDLDPAAHQGAQMLKQLLSKFDLASMKDLVCFWLAQGVCLALAEPFVKKCTEATDRLRAKWLSQEINWHLALTQYLMQNSSCPLEYGESSTLSSFTGQFCDRNIRLETLGIVLSAVIRATFDVPLFPSLYTSEAERYQLQTLATRLIDCALELCLSLDCLNDLQLVFQYENWIVHSYVDGNQSELDHLR